MEAASGTTTATFTVSLSGTSGQTVAVNYATAGNTATAGIDFVVASGTATIAAGLLSTTINITINSDTTFEPTETFFVNLSNPSNATISDNQGVGTIVDDGPVLATEENSQRAIALNSMFLFRDPFAITNPGFFGTDQRTRVALFATNLTLTPGLVVTAEAVDAQQTTHQLQVEFVGSLPSFPEITQLNVKLPDGITVAGELQLRITVNGRVSNVVLVGVKP